LFEGTVVKSTGNPVVTYQPFPNTISSVTTTENKQLPGIVYVCIRRLY